MESGISSTNPESHLIQNPSSTDKHWNAVPGIRNPQRGIHNPRLCWIPLHEATGRDPTVVQRVGNSLEHFPREFFWVARFATIQCLILISL